MNSLLELQTGLFDDVVDFKKLNVKEFLPALKKSIQLAEKRIEFIVNEKEATFQTIIEQLENASIELDRVVTIYYALHGAHCTDEMVEIAEEFDKNLTDFNSDLYLNAGLFQQVKKVKEQNESLDPIEKRLLDKVYNEFVRNGALLEKKQKEVLREVDSKLSSESLAFSENVRNETNGYLKFVDKIEDLKGIPQRALDAAKELATEKNRPEAWAFSLQYPSFSPLLKYCENRELRKEIYTAFASRATRGEKDNSKIVLNILKLRQKRAQLLGYKNHVEFTLKKRMASSPEIVLNFLGDLYKKAKPLAEKEVKSLQEMSEEKVEAYDSLYLSEKLKKKVLDFDDESLKPYFKLENVIEGAFAVAEKLYGLNFNYREDIESYHSDVKVYEVTCGDKYIGVFYADFFPRKEKRPGAWMTVLREQGLEGSMVRRPHVMNVCNFTPSTKSSPSLLTYDSVKTLFHEFGHALHGLLSNSKYKTLSGTNVYWDFVELPSQIMENWVAEKECLNMFAKHYETGEEIPDDLIEKIQKAENFLEGMATMRQISFANLDMQSHLANTEEIDNIFDFEEKLMEPYQLFPKPKGTNQSCAFGHLYAGGYSAGYYSYKWAEVLDADAFSLFKERGLFDQETAKSFRENILEKGDTEDPMELFKRFRGREPKVDALLERSGLT